MELFVALFITCYVVVLKRVGIKGTRRSDNLMIFNLKRAHGMGFCKAVRRLNRTPNILCPRPFAARDHPEDIRAGETDEEGADALAAWGGEAARQKRAEV